MIKNPGPNNILMFYTVLMTLIVILTILNFELPFQRLA